MNDAPELFNIVKQWETELKRVKKQKKGTTMNLKIEIKNITKSQAIAFALFLRKVEYYGQIGRSGTIGLFADGDGNMRPTITTDLDLTEEQLTAYTEFALGTIETKNGNKIPVFDFDKIPEQKEQQ